MRLLVVSNLYPPNIVGGYERLCYDAVSGLVERGHQVTVLTSLFGDKTEDFPGQKIHRSLRLLIGNGIYAPFAGSAEERDAINRANAAALRQAIAATQPDAIFAWNLFFLDRAILDALAASGRKVLLMLTDNWLLTVHRPEFWMRFFQEHVLGDQPFLPPAAVACPARPGDGFAERAMRRLRCWFAGNAAAAARAAATPPPEATIRFPFAAIFGSGFVRDLYAAGGIAFARGKVVHNGVDQMPYRDRQPRTRSTLIDPQELRLLFVGRLVDLKGAHTAVAALPLLDPADLGVGRVRLSIVGDMRDAAYVRQLEEVVERTGCRAQVTIEPPVPEPALFDLFQAHDIYVFPSLYEPFSLTLIHGLASGIPTVASRAGGNVEIVHDRETGLLF
jgi:glycosyltransferase involved in cell wall biosynthesis